VSRPVSRGVVVAMMFGRERLVSGRIAIAPRTVIEELDKPAGWGGNRAVRIVRKGASGNNCARTCVLKSIHDVACAIPSCRCMLRIYSGNLAILRVVSERLLDEDRGGTGFN
jgi:hypothetical protein